MAPVGALGPLVDVVLHVHLQVVENHVGADPGHIIGAIQARNLSSETQQQGGKPVMLTLPGDHGQGATLDGRKGIEGGGELGVIGRSDMRSLS